LACHQTFWSLNKEEGDLIVDKEQGNPVADVDIIAAWSFPDL
jgi:hypothetical protein